MAKENIFRTMWAAIKLFINTITGKELREIAILQTQITEKISKNIYDLYVDETQKFIKTMNQLVQLNKKPITIFVMNKKGKTINLTASREINTNVRYEPNGNYLLCELYFNRELFEVYRLDLTSSYLEHPSRSLILYANKLLKERKEGLTDLIGTKYLINIFGYSNQAQIISHLELMELLAVGLMNSVKNEYCLENDLKDFDLTKGPIEKGKQKEKEQA